MILTDEVADRVHRLLTAMLRNVADGARRVRKDALLAEMGSAVVLFAGDGSPLTQAVGFGHREAADPEALEAFFSACSAMQWEVWVTPFTDSGTFRALLDRGYRPAQFEGSLAQWVGDVPEPNTEIVEVEGDLSAWLETTGRGWSEDESANFVPGELERIIAATGARRYLAFVDGQPAAAASMVEFEEGVVLGGASTRVPFRGLGLQRALLQRRLRDAGRGRFAYIGAMPGTASYRNAQRAGFVPLYSTLTLTRR